MTKYINLLSSEDTFITFSGELITKQEEGKYLGSVLADMEFGNKVVLYCFTDEKLIGVCDIYRDTQHKKRSMHVGIFGLTVAKEFRGDGIGHELAETTIEEAKKIIPGLKLITLQCYSPNTPALNLYKKLGFEEAGRVPKSVLFQGEYVDAIQMFLPILS